MDGIEKAIRNAFEKGDPSQRAFREKVYRSAFAALDRALAANPNVTEAIALRRREAVSAKIAEIESEFIPAVPSVAPPVAAAPQRTPDPVQVPPNDAGFAPVVTREDREEFAPEYRQPAAYEEPARGRRARTERSRRSWMSPVLSLVVLAVVGAGAWWMLSGGPMDRAVQVPPQTSQPPANQAQPPRVPGVDDLAGWISIFDPSDPTTVSTPGDARAEVMEDDGAQFVRVTAGASGTPILFDVGQGVLEQVAGRRAVFNIVARAPEGETQMSVECSLADLGDCGRKRYAVGGNREEFLFEMNLPSADPGAGGSIAINPDVEGGSNAVDIYAIRVTLAQ